MSNNNQIIIYQTADNQTQIDVHMENETVWLTQAQMAELFQKDRTVISRHIRNVFNEGELEEQSTCAKFAHMGNDGLQQYETVMYNLDVIISVGYRVKSQRGTAFRIWATKVLKEYMLRGYAVNQRIVYVEEYFDKRLRAHEQRIENVEQKIDFFVRTSLPPHQGIFYDGQIFDAYTFINDRIRESTTRIVLIDNYIDDSILTILSKRANKVTATIYTKKPSAQLQLDIQKHNAQYAPIEILEFDRAHDRFLCIDETVYHLGASIKDLGKKWFAFNRMEITVSELLQKIQTTHKTPPS